jgi:hypothetical protein
VPLTLMLFLSIIFIGLPLYGLSNLSYRSNAT